MTVGGDPGDLEDLAAGGPGQAFTLTHVARGLEQAGGWHRRRSPGTTVGVAPAVAGMRHLADRILELDAWVRTVAVALRDADRAPVSTSLLALGAGHPLSRSRPGERLPPHVLRALPDEQLDELAGVAGLASHWRDGVHRERLRRWLGGLGDRLASVPDDDVGRLASWFDARFVDRLSPVLDLHRAADEIRSRLRQEATQAQRLLTTPGLTVWSFEPGDPPTVRIALGDPGTATHLAVLLPGTSTGLHAADTSLDDATALHDTATRLAPNGVRVATVLDLYAAPPDLGRAVDPGPARAAGASAATFLAELPTRPNVTLVGHSYGAVTAARTSDHHPVDDLVLLGAPGAGVASRADLTGAGRVWAARAERDPIGVVADLDELLAALPPRWRPTHGPLSDPLVAHGPDPTDPAFGARHLPTAATGGGVAGPAVRGHVDYLRPGTASLVNVARIVAGRPPATPTPGGVRRARPPRRDRPARAADG